MADTMVVTGRGQNKIGRSFSADGTNWLPRVMAGVKIVRLEFKESGHVLDMPLDDLSPEIVRMAAAFGLNTTVGNMAGGAADETEAIDSCEDRWQDLLNGHWATERTGGPRGGDLLAAFERVYKAAGAEMPQAMKDDLLKSLAEKTRKPKDLLKDPRVHAAYEAIKAERAAERRSKILAAAEAAKDQALPTL